MITAQVEHIAQHPQNGFVYLPHGQHVLYIANHVVHDEVSQNQYIDHLKIYVPQESERVCYARAIRWIRRVVGHEKVEVVQQFLKEDLRYFEYYETPVTREEKE